MPIPWEQRPSSLLRCPSGGKRLRSASQCHRSCGSPSLHHRQPPHKPDNTNEHQGTRTTNKLRPTRTNTHQPPAPPVRRAARRTPCPPSRRSPFDRRPPAPHPRPAPTLPPRRPGAFVPDPHTGLFRPGLLEAREFAESWSWKSRNRTPPQGGDGLAGPVPLTSRRLLWLVRAVKGPFFALGHSGRHGL
jgi:hypothetical protein